MEFIKQKEEEYKSKFASPYVAVKYGYLDDANPAEKHPFQSDKSIAVACDKKRYTSSKKTCQYTALKRRGNDKENILSILFGIVGVVYSQMLTQKRRRQRTLR